MAKMALVLAAAFSISVPSVFGVAVESRSALEHEHVVSLPMWMYKSDCWKRQPVAGVSGLLQYVPGAGIKEFTPFETVLKDGFMEIDCVKDYMYYHGDKFGDARHAYKLEDVSNTSIVHYDAHVAKMDRKPMTQAVCFEFCRTVPNMGFFGLINGRNCYCAPYYKQMAGDSSMCDAVCPGEETTMCGGKSKSSIFALHNCDSTEGDLKASETKATDLAGTMDTNVASANKLSGDLQKHAADLQKSFGSQGDAAAARLFQRAKEFAGEMEHQAEEVEALSKDLKDLAGKAGGIKDFKDPAEVTEAEGIMQSVDMAVAKASASNAKLEKQIEFAEVSDPKKDAAVEYFPIMHFVDKKHEELPSTCGGDLVNEPIVGDANACATACNNNFQTCVGFSHFAPENLCFLLSKFQSAFYYTGCKSLIQKPAFLQESKADPSRNDVTCYAKLSRFESTSLKPDPSGKCKACLRELTKADRCFK